MSLKKSQIRGIYAPSTQTFYHLISGPCAPDLNKLNNILVGEGIILVDKDTHIIELTIMSYEEAETKGHKIEPRFLTKMVKEAWEKNGSTLPTSKVW